MAQELRLVGRRRWVETVSSEFPCYVVGYVDVEVDVGDPLPKGDKLNKVFDGFYFVLKKKAISHAIFDLRAIWGYMNQIALYVAGAAKWISSVFLRI